MKTVKTLAVILTLTLLLAACGATHTDPQNTPSIPGGNVAETDPVEFSGTEITLDDDSITVNGTPAGSDPADAVYIANDIVYYESGMDFTYGEGTEDDAHSAEEAAAHTVVHITQPGTYCISGTLSQGQIAVDLGDDAEEDPNSVVTLILNGVDITCEVAPAVIFYNVYECGSDDADTASKNVDTSAAGANVIIADGSVNTVNGSYVARIYKPGSVVLNEAGTEVEDAKKLHKYDAAFYSKKSMNINGGKQNTGILNINAENEGLDSELHLTVNGGIINIKSGNDGINTNEDGISVTTINGGALSILVTGETGEGDGIDSNGWLVINGGTVIAAACSNSADAGIDSDMGIHINGGTVIATGHMLDQIENGGQTYAVFNFTQQQNGTEAVYLKNEAGESLMELIPTNRFSVLVYSSPSLTAGTYTLWNGSTQLAVQSGGMMGGMGGRPGSMQGMPNMNPDGTTPPELPEGVNPDDLPEGMTPPEGYQPPDGEYPTDGQERPEWPDRPEGEKPDGEQRPDGGEGIPGGGRFPNGNYGGNTQEATTEFLIADGGNMFSVVSA